QALKLGQIAVWTQAVVTHHFSGMPEPLLPEHGSVSLSQLTEALRRAPTVLKCGALVEMTVVAIRMPDGMAAHSSSFDVGVEGDEENSKVLDADGVYLIRRRIRV